MSAFEIVWVVLLLVGLTVAAGGAMAAIVLTFLDRWDAAFKTFLVAAGGLVLAMFIGVTGSLFFGGAS